MASGIATYPVCSYWRAISEPRAAYRPAATISMPIMNSTPIAPSTTMPCRMEPIIFPNVHGNANGIMSISHT